VAFTNHFHTQIQQKATKGGSEDAGVFFIADTDMDGIIRRYRELTQVLDVDGKPAMRFYLGWENRTFEGYADKYGFTPVSNDRMKTGSLMNQSLMIVSAVARMTPRQIREKYEFDQVGLRKLGLRLIKLVRDGNPTPDQVVRSIRESLGLKAEPESLRVEGQLGRLAGRVSRDPAGNGGLHQYSSIHKAKGLEADAVLVVASSEAKLEKWLETDEGKRCDDTSDTCRVGFVGFSRAKQILCIACKKQISDDLKDKLRALGVRTE
jgi:DNA helicase-2/ATP-dependent DNA helicase PcrA